MELITIVLCMTFLPSVLCARYDRGRSLDENRIESQSVPHHVAQRLLNQPYLPSEQFSAKLIPPKKKHLKEKKLRRILGDDFDERWVSVNKPTVVSGQQRSVKSDQNLITDLNRVNTSAVLMEKGVVSLKPGVSKLIEKWLLQKARCDVHFKWEDVGEFFWPRWIKRGICGNGKRDNDGIYLPGYEPRQNDGDEYQYDDDDDDDDDMTSCSWPPGMHCVPASSNTVQMLRWHCYPRWVRIKNTRKSRKGKGNSVNTDDIKKKDRKGRRQMRTKCKWIKVPYPVTSECYCSC